MRVADMLGMVEAVAECEKYFLQTIDLYNPEDLFHLAEVTSSFPIMREIVRNWKVACINRGLRNCACEEYSTKSCVGSCLYDKNLYDLVETVYIVGGYYHGSVADCISISLLDFTREPSVDFSNQSCSFAESPYKYNTRYLGPVSEEYRVVTLDTDIYLTGGFDVKAKATNQVWKYDTRKDEWSRVSGMRNPR